MKQHNSASHTLFNYLQHELCVPIDSTIAYSELLLEKLERLQSQPSPTLFEDLQRIRDCAQQLLSQVTVILDRNRPLLSQSDGDLSGFGATLRTELITPLSAAIGYCEMLLEEAPAELRLDLEKLNGSARQILSAINNVVSLAQQQMQTAFAEPEDFSFINLDDAVEPVDSELSQTTRVFSLATQDASAFEQPIDLDRSIEPQSPILRLVKGDSQSNSQSNSQSDSQSDRVGSKAVKTKHLQQLQERDRGSLDTENLHRSSLYPPLSRQSHLESSWAASHQATNLSKIVAVHSFRGGTGKSNIASSLAMSLAKQGRRVGVVDTDLLSPGMHVLFGLQDRSLGRTLNDYLRGDCLLHEAALDMSHWLSRDSMRSDRAGKGAIYLVPASPKPSDIMRVAKERYEQESLTDGFRELIDRLKLDFLLIDTRSGISEETLQAIAVCSLLLVVLRPDYQDYRGTSVILELARMLSVEEIRLVVNKVLPTFDIDAYCEQLEATYEVPVTKVLPFYEDIVQLASSEIFSVRYPHHPLAVAIDDIARDIASSIEPSRLEEDRAIASAMTLL